MGFKDSANSTADKCAAGTAPWVRPWTTSGVSDMPTNFATQRHYHGTNVLNLWMAQTALGCETAEWMTFKQASDLVRAAGRSAAFVITQARARAPEIAQTHEALAEHGFPIAPVVIGERAAYARAITGGKAVTEFDPPDKQPTRSAPCGRMSRSDSMAKPPSISQYSRSGRSTAPASATTENGAPHTTRSKNSPSHPGNGLRI